MSPIDYIREWFDGEEEEIRVDIASLMLVLLADDDGWFSPDHSVMLSGMDELFSPTGTPKWRIVGKAISFIGCFEFMARDRFSAAGWQKIRDRQQSVVDELERKGQGELAEPMRRALEDLPERERAWIAVGERWRALKAAHLGADALQRWAMIS